MLTLIIILGALSTLSLIYDSLLVIHDAKSFSELSERML